MLKIATYNIQKSIGLDARRDPERIFEVILEVEPDILALQELDRRFGNRKATLPASEIVARSHLKPISFSAHAHGLGWHGNGMLVHKSAIVLSKRCIDLPQFEPRGAVMATIDIMGIKIRIVSVHLSVIGNFRKRQIAHIVSEIASEPTRLPTVVLGDLNEWSRSSASMRAFGTHFQAVETGNSFPSLLPIVPLDRILVTPDLNVEIAGVHRSRLAKIASDHLPAWARVSLPSGIDRRGIPVTSLPRSS